MEKSGILLPDVALTVAMSGCYVCKNPKANLVCGVCQQSVCKRCAEPLRQGEFEHLVPKPPELAHEIYCNYCFNGKVQPAKENYDETLEKAKGVLVFLKSKSEETRQMKRKEKPISVEDCDDYDGTILRLAFRAAQLGFNAIVDVALTSKQIRNAGYQTSRWSGSCIPVRVDAERLELEEKWTHEKTLLPLR